MGLMTSFDSSRPSRRSLLAGALGAAAAVALPHPASAAPADFDRWRDALRSRALSRGIPAQTFDRVMGRIEPDMSVFKEIRSQPEFREQLVKFGMEPWAANTSEQFGEVIRTDMGRWAAVVKASGAKVD